MTDYADYNPAGAVRTSKIAETRLIPLQPDYFNHNWFEDFKRDFIYKNILENNGITAGCVISGDGVDTISCTSGETLIGGSKITVATPPPFVAVDDGWYIAYVTNVGVVIYGSLINTTVQGSLTPDDAAIIGYAVKGNGVFNVYSFFNNLSEFVATDKDVDFESKDLLIDLLSVTQVDVTAKRLSLLDSSFIPKFINDLDLTWTMPTDLELGTSEKPSTYYDIWLDSDQNKRLVPHLASTTNGTTSFKLVDSGAAFLTDLVKAGDIASNRKNGTKTTVSVDAILEGEVSVTDDIFVSGDDYEIIKLSPEGLGNNRENVGSAFNSSGSDLTKVLKNGQAKITTSFWNTSNGHGSSSTKIQKFVTEVDASDDVVVTIVNSATLGFVITANMSCKLHITYNAAFNIGGWLGISKNSTQLTLGVSSISATDRMALTTSPNADEPGSVSWSGILAINDVIRPHTNGSVDGATPSFSSIHVLAEEII